MSHIFIAHVEEDAEIALGIAIGLEEAGYYTWCYEIDSIPGTSYIVRTGEAVAQSDAVVVIISPHSLSSSQVTKEIVRAHESAKHFIPILRDITHAEFQKRQPEWREAIGSATSIRVPSDGIVTLILPIIEGIKSLGIKPSAKVNTVRINRIRKELDEIRNLPISHEPEPVATTKKTEEGKKVKSKKPLVITLASVIVVAIIILVIFLPRGGNDKGQDRGSTSNITSPTPLAASTSAPPVTPPTATPVTDKPTLTPTPTPTPKPAPTPTPEPTPSPTPEVQPPVPSPKLMYEDDFSDTKSGWVQQYSQTYEVNYKDDEFHILEKEPNVSYYTVNRNAGQFTDFNLEIDARLVNGSNKSVYGVVFRFKDNKNYYRFEVSGDGYYIVGTRFNDMWGELQKITKSAYIKEGNSINRLKVVCKGSQIEVYVNGYYLTRITDYLFTEGYVGMIVYSLEGNTRVAFDNIRVYSLD